MLGTHETNWEQSVLFTWPCLSQGCTADAIVAPLNETGGGGQPIGLDGNTSLR